MTTLTNTFAGIGNGIAVTTGNSGGASGDAFAAVTGTNTVATGQTLSATWDRAVTPSVSAATSSYVEWTISGTAHHLRLYISLASLPPATMRLARWYNGSTIVAELRIGTAGELILTRGSDGAFIVDSDNNLSTGTVYRVEIDLTTSGSPTGGMRVYLGESLTQWTTITSWGAGDTAAATTALRIGAMFTAAQTYSGLRYASIGWSDTDTLGPTGPTLAITDSVGVTDPGPGTGDVRWTLDLTDDIGVTDAATSSGVSTAEPPSTPLLGVGTRLAGGIAWCYSLQEHEGATTAGDVSGAGGMPTLTLTEHEWSLGQGTATFGTAGIMPEGTACLFQVGEVVGSGLTLGSPRVQGYCGADFTLFAQYAWSGGGTQTLVTLGDGLPDAPQRLRLRASSGQVLAETVDVYGATTTVTRSAATGDSRPHFVALVSAGGMLRLHVDRLPPATGSLPELGTLDGLTIGSVDTLNPHQLAWVGFAHQAMTADEVDALAMLATAGSERSDLRVARILRWLDVDADLVADVGQSDVAYQATGGAEALDLIHAVETVEQGVFFATQDGRFAFHGRARRYQPSPRLTVESGSIDAGTAIAVDATRLVNDLSAARPGGRTYRARNAASADRYGPYGAPSSSPMTIYAATDNDLVAVAEWIVQRNGDVAPRIPALAFDLLTQPDLAYAVLSLDIGDVVRVTGLPDTAPGGTTVDLTVEGIDEQVSPETWTVTLWTSPTSDGRVWLLDEAALDDLTVLTY